MKSFLLICGVCGLCLFLGVHHSVAHYFSPGAWHYGFDEDDPLGNPSTIHTTLLNVGFEGDLGEIGSPRTITFTHPSDKERMPDFPSVLLVKVGEEEYVQRISGVFVGTQHGYSPQRPTAVERQLVGLWEAVHAPAPKFKLVQDAPITVSLSGKLSAPFSIPQSHYEAKFVTPDVEGAWYYASQYPLEVIELRVR